MNGFELGGKMFPAPTPEVVAALLEELGESMKQRVFQRLSAKAQRGGFPMPVTSVSTVVLPDSTRLPDR